MGTDEPSGIPGQLKTIDYADLPHPRPAMDYWGEVGEETYSHEDIDDLIGDILAGRVDLWASTPFDVEGVRRMTLGGAEPCAIDILDSAVEGLDEDYGGDDGGSGSTPAMRAAAEAFCAVIRAEYHVWACSPVLRVRVIPEMWLARNDHPKQEY